MAKYTGNKGSVYVGSDKIGELKGWTFDTSVAEIDSTDLDDEYEGVEAGTKSASGSIVVRYDPDDAIAEAAFEEGNKVQLNLYPVGNIPGKTYYKIPSAFISSVGYAGERNVFIERSISFKADGGYTKETVPVI